MRDLTLNEIENVSGGLDSDLEMVAHNKYKMFQSAAIKDSIICGGFVGTLAGGAAAILAGTTIPTTILVGLLAGAVGSYYEYNNSDIWPSYLK